MKNHAFINYYIIDNNIEKYHFVMFYLDGYIRKHNRKLQKN